MTSNETLLSLKEKINQIVKDNPAQAMSKSDKDIFLFEEELRELGLTFPIETSFTQLDESLESHLFNQQHQFSGKDYLLKWDIRVKSNSTWGLLVLNQKSQGQKSLLECPQEMKEKLIPLLPVFAKKIAIILND